MELPFITSALRRYWWVVILGALGGVLAATVLAPSGPAGYTSRAVLLLQAPSDSFQSYRSNDPDRYVKGQLNVLNSEVLAQRVAERVDPDLRPAEVASLVSFTHEPLTDVVHVEVTSQDPELSQAIGNAYLDIYFESLRAQIEDTQAPEIEQLDAQIATIRDQLNEIDEAIEDALEPFRDRDAVPSIEQVSPRLASEKGVLLSQYENLLGTKNELNTNARLRVSSEVVQRATLPTHPTSSSTKLFRVAGLVGGGLAGAFAAIVMARMSSRVLGDDEVRELIGHAVVGRLPYQPEMRALPGHLVDRHLPDPAGSFVQRLCVRTEGIGVEGDLLSVLVVGSQRAAGTTSLATAMARRYAEAGAAVLLVDADLVHRGRPVGQGRPPDAGVAVASGPSAQAVSAYGRIELASIRDVAGPQRGRGAFDSIRTDALQRGFDIVVFDGGPLLESSVAVLLARHCDAIVVAVPERQDTAGLAAVGQELTGYEVLPVATMRHQIFDRIGSWRQRRASAARSDGGDHSPGRPSVPAGVQARPAPKQPTPVRRVKATTASQRSSTRP
ncbi:MAG: hypothetical protein GXY13_13305 [Acidimicrobiales bacterium]|nr:hypothetical protein [Acidimicrobiales bacterium]